MTGCGGVVVQRALDIEVLAREALVGVGGAGDGVLAGVGDAPEHAAAGVGRGRPGAGLGGDGGYGPSAGVRSGRNGCGSSLVRTLLHRSNARWRYSGN